MIVTCPCGTEFLTEADMYIVLPTGDGNKLFCWRHTYMEFRQKMLKSSTDASSVQSLGPADDKELAERLSVL